MARRAKRKQHTLHFWPDSAELLLRQLECLPGLRSANPDFDIEVLLFGRRVRREKEDEVLKSEDRLHAANVLLAEHADFFD